MSLEVTFLRVGGSVLDSRKVSPTFLAFRTFELVQVGPMCPREQTSLSPGRALAAQTMHPGSACAQLALGCVRRVHALTLIVASRLLARRREACPPG